jgi:TetR/AcrR family transcriptional regulator, cholesterol catabolism regulator
VQIVSTGVFRSIFAAEISILPRPQQIIESATKLFMQYGIKSVNMDDMARHLGMSKKTIYLHFKDKEDLVKKAVRSFCKLEDVQIEEICSRKLNAIDEMLEISKWVMSVLTNIHPSVMYDLEKYYPEVAASLKASRHKIVYDSMHSNVLSGQKQGLYRKDVNADIVVKLYIARMDSVFDQRLFPMSNYKVLDIYLENFRYHIRGIASEKGMQYLEQHMKKTKK